MDLLFENFVSRELRHLINNEAVPRRLALSRHLSLFLDMFVDETSMISEHGPEKIPCIPRILFF